MVHLLFKHKVDPYKNNGQYNYRNNGKNPLLLCKTREIAEIFIDNKVSAHDDTYPNVLWRILGDEYSSDLMKCYLEKGIDSTKVYNHPNTSYHPKVPENICLLHEIASGDGKDELKNSDQLLEKAKFLLDAMPKDMVNALSLKRTPIDIAQMKCSKRRKEKSPYVNFYERLVCLYREYGGLSSFALNKKLAAHVEEHNQNHPLLSILFKEDFKENMYSIFSCCQVHGDNQQESLKKSIKNYMRLRGVCKGFNELLTEQVIGDQCKDYTQDDKNKVLETVLKSWTSYKTKRLAALTLVYAGADPNIKIGWSCKSEYLLGEAVDNNDEQMVEALFKHKVHVNVISHALYKTKEMARMFINNGVDVHVPVDGYPNVLWHVVHDDYSSDLMKFYLEQGVDPKKLSDYDYYGSKQDLLCYFTDSNSKRYYSQGDDQIKKLNF